MSLGFSNTVIPYLELGSAKNAILRVPPSRTSGLAEAVLVLGPQWARDDNGLVRTAGAPAMQS